MPFDGMVLAAVKKELAATLIGLRIDKIYQPAGEEIHFILSKPGGKYRLLLSADSGSARVHITGKAGENPQSPPVFCMVLRKHLEGGRISGFSQPGYDRVLVISVDARDELGRPANRQIICEIMGKHSNIILLDPESNIILDGIKRYSHSLSRHREVLPGRHYISPPAPGKTTPLTLNEDGFFSLMLGGSLGGRLSDLVQRHFDGLSPLTAREVVWRAGLDPDTALELCGEVELTSVFLILRDLYFRAEKGDFSPALACGGQTPQEFAAFDLSHLQSCRMVSGTMNEVVDEYYSHRERAGQLDRLRRSILGVVRKESGRLAKKLKSQKDDLESAAGAEHFKLCGELVTASIHRLQRGDTEVFLDNYYLEGCPPVKINLDPGLSPSENAQEFFRRYAKAKKVLEHASKHAGDTKNSLDYLAGVENSAELAGSLDDLMQIRAELTDQGLIKTNVRGPARRKAPDPPRPATFRSSDGFALYVGRNNRQNDYLTMKIARPEDIWLHAREMPGSHVVIRTGGAKVPPSTLEEAAKLAALFSKGRHSGKVPVDYTLRSFVHKPKGSRPGFVIYTGQKTIMAEPDGSLPERLSSGQTPTPPGAAPSKR